MKIQFMRDRSPVEVFGFGISAAPEGPDALLITDFWTVPQVSSETTWEADGASQALIMSRAYEKGLSMDQCIRIGIHTHPGNSPHPSMSDEENFEAVHGPQSWAVMAIVAQDDSCYARIRYKDGPGLQTVIPVVVGSRKWEDGHRVDLAAWEDELKQNVQHAPKFERMSYGAWNGNNTTAGHRQGFSSSQGDRGIDLRDVRRLDDDFDPWTGDLKSSVDS